MSKLGLLVTLILAASPIVNGMIITDSIEFLNSFLKHENQPTILYFLFSCSTTLQMVTIHKELRNFMIAFRSNLSSSDGMISDIAADVVFLIDLECSADTETILTV